MFGNMPILSLLIWLPLFGGGIILLSPFKKNYKLIQVISIFFVIITLFICYFIIKDF